jgi:hypothetical protein
MAGADNNQQRAANTTAVAIAVRGTRQEKTRSGDGGSGDALEPAGTNMFRR